MITKEDAVPETLVRITTGPHEGRAGRIYSVAKDGRVFVEPKINGPLVLLKLDEIEKVK
jgi:transcription antitermination factor NusG